VAETQIAKKGDTRNCCIFMATLLIFFHLFSGKVIQAKWIV
jgi:hypothetical protein